MEVSPFSLDAANLHLVDPFEEGLKLMNKNPYSANKPAIAVGLSKSRFQHWLQKKELHPKATAPKRGSPTVLAQNEEKTVVETLIFLSCREVGLPVKMLNQKVAMICSDGKSVPFNVKAGPGKSGSMAVSNATLTDFLYEKKKAIDAILTNLYLKLSVKKLDVLLKFLS